MKFHIKENSPLILTVAAAAGTIGTAYLTGRAAIRASDILRAAESDPSEPKLPLSNKEKVKRVWKLYVPPGLSAVTTIACVVGANRIQAKETLAAQAAVAITQRAYSEYREKVIEEIGVKKDQKIKDTIREEKVKASPPPSVVAGSGTVLCCELMTGRYFNSDMETLKKAVNQVNSRMLRHDYASLDEFYDLVPGLYGTSLSGYQGWRAEKLLELDITTVMSPDGRPCLAFDYNYVEKL